MATRMYCGNKANYTGIVTGTHYLGTYYQCMRRGIGVGRNLPYDVSYTGLHVPVDPRRYYCGNSLVPPIDGGYYGVGSPSKCLSTGIGVGKSQRASMGAPYGMNFVRHYLQYIIFLGMVCIIFSILYLTKPKFITIKDINNNDIIDWDKFIPYFLLLCLITGIIILWFWKRYVRVWV
jgi:hypothetical protein